MTQGNEQFIQKFERGELTKKDMTVDLYYALKLKGYSDEYILEKIGSSTGNFYYFKKKNQLVGVKFIKQDDGSIKIVHPEVPNQSTYRKNLESKTEKSSPNASVQEVPTSEEEKEEETADFLTRMEKQVIEVINERDNLSEENTFLKHELKEANDGIVELREELKEEKGKVSFPQYTFGTNHDEVLILREELRIKDQMIEEHREVIKAISKLL